MQPPDFWYGSARSPWPGMLVPAAYVYDCAARLERAFTIPHRLPVPVVCVGNLVAGGAGKTPTAIAVAERLIGLGVSVHFLSRGYGRRASHPVRVEPFHTAADVGDEALLLARMAPTWVGADRRITAMRAVAEGAAAIVMDDGFQNRELVQDLSLIVVDGAVGLGNGRVLPAGPLRERPQRAIARAHGIVVVGDDRTEIGARLASLAPRALPVFHARLVPGDRNESWHTRRVVAFAGIARPEKLFTSLKEAGCDVVATQAFSDHHRFRTSELVALRQRARELDATLVTTEKDRARLSASDAERIAVFAVRLEWRDPPALDAWLATVVAQAVRSDV